MLGIIVEFFPILGAAIGWFLLICWFVTIRVSLEGRASLKANRLWLALVTIAAFYPLGFAILVGIFSIEKEALLSRPLIWAVGPIHVAALTGIFSACWTAARALVNAEPSHSAVRWERTALSFLELLFNPIGVWFFHPRYQRVIDGAT